MRWILPGWFGAEYSRFSFRSRLGGHTPLRETDVQEKAVEVQGWVFLKGIV